MNAENSTFTGNTTVSISTSIVLQQTKMPPVLVHVLQDSDLETLQNAAKSVWGTAASVFFGAALGQGTSAYSAIEKLLAKQQLQGNEQFTLWSTALLVIVGCICLFIQIPIRLKARKTVVEIRKRPKVAVQSSNDQQATI